MQGSTQFAGRRVPLKQMIADASLALARLDAETLEALAIACGTCERVAAEEATTRDGLALEATNAANQMLVFSRLLDVTKQNLSVMRQATTSAYGHEGYGPCAK
jgi:hypothetical protein